MEQRIKVGIVGVGKDGSRVYRKLKTMDMVEISMVCDISDQALGMVMAEYDGIRKYNSVEEVLKLDLDLDVVINTTGSPEVQLLIEQLKSPQTSLLGPKGADLLLSVVEADENLRERKRLQEELEAVYSSVQQGIVVADKYGTIQYVNPSYSRISGISPKERVGKNIFDISPDGALAKVLRTHEPIYAHRSQLGDSSTEVISNATPIIVDGNFEAACSVFYPYTDNQKLLEQLDETKQEIDEYKAHIAQIAASSYTFDDILGSHPDYVRIKSKALRSAKTNASIMILGEGGTEKEIFAEAIHSSSTRRNRPFIKAECADIPESLLEAELFGYERVIRGKVVDKRLGKLELASGGTLFLYEIGEMNLLLQSKLIHILKNKVFTRVGGSQEICLDVRLIVSTNRDLQERVKNGQFSSELYAMFDAIEIQLPPLREHKEDVLTYAQSFVFKNNRKFGKNVIGITTQAEQLLLDYNWPGNIRELKNVIECVMDSAQGDMLHYEDFANLIKPSDYDIELNLREPMALDEVERKMIFLALQRYGNSVEGKKQAAKVLNISLATLYNKLKTLE